MLKVPEGSRINYQLEVRRGQHVERFNDPLNPKHSHSPFGASSVCFAHGYITPAWTFPDESAHQASSPNSPWTAEQCSAIVR